MKTHITARGFELNAELNRYIRHKLAELNRKLPRGVRAEIACTLTLTQKHRKDGDTKTCAIVLQLPNEKLQAQETTQHMYAALDIVAEAMSEQVRAYKTRNRRRGLRARLNARPDRDE
jgi:putative sigma-54 modulation protein